MNNKKILNAAVACFAMTAMLSPSVSLAVARQQTGQSEKVGGTKASQVRFCEIIAEAGKLNEKMLNKEQRILVNQNEKEKKVAEKREQYGTKRLENWSNWDEKKSERLDFLKTLAKTDEQKQALSEFQASVSKAVTVRREALKAAIVDFQKKVDEIVAARKQKVNAALSQFKNSVKAAEEKAKADCAAGVEAKTVKNTYQEAVKTARKTYL